MQNRNMFLYRRQGTKKRTKPGGPPRKNRSQQKGLPNSARDLLPLIQPATKALAQMLAGRTGSSGQLGHARAVLAQTERLVSERAHNRLNPAEREEFFEQVARLKLTLADADSEAEVQAMEEEAEPVAAPTPVNRERLKEMAMALTTPSAPVSYENRHGASTDSSLEKSALDDASDLSAEDQSEEEAAQPVIAKQPEDPNQLRLPRAGSERVAIQPGVIRQRSNGRRRIAKPEEPTSLRKPAAKAAEAEPVPAIANNESTERPVTAPSGDPSSKQKLPKGWVIDDDGFVVPGPAG